MATVADLGPHLGVQPLCAAFGVSTATYYRLRGPVPPRPRPRRTPARASGSVEQKQDRHEWMRWLQDSSGVSRAWYVRM